MMKAPGARGVLGAHRAQIDAAREAAREGEEAVVVDHRPRGIREQHPHLGVGAREHQPLDGLEEGLLAVDQRLEVLCENRQQALRGFRHLEARFANFGHGGENGAGAGCGVASAGCGVAARHRYSVRDRLRPVVRITRHTSMPQLEGAGRTCSHGLVLLTAIVPCAYRAPCQLRHVSDARQRPQGAPSARARARLRRASSGASPRYVFGSSASKRCFRLRRQRRASR